MKCSSCFKEAQGMVACDTIGSGVNKVMTAYAFVCYDHLIELVPKLKVIE